MKIFLTGASGFIGSAILRRLILEGHDVRALARNRVPQELEIEKVFHLKNLDKISDYFIEEQFDGVIHLASEVTVNHDFDKIPDLVESNIKLPLFLLESAKKAKVKWFINTGTFWQHYLCEGYRPLNLYAATKEALQTLAKYYTETSGLSFITLKLNDTFGPGDKRNKLLSFLKEAAVSNKLLKMTKGEQILDICHIDYVVDAYLKLIELVNSDQLNNKDASFALHLANRISIKDFVRMFEENLGRRLNIEWGGVPYRERENMVPWSGGIPVPGLEPYDTLEHDLKYTLIKDEVLSGER